MPSRFTPEPGAGGCHEQQGRNEHLDLDWGLPIGPGRRHHPDVGTTTSRGYEDPGYRTRGCRRNLRDPTDHGPPKPNQGLGHRLQPWSRPPQNVSSVSHSQEDATPNTEEAESLKRREEPLCPWWTALSAPTYTEGRFTT